VIFLLFLFSVFTPAIFAENRNYKQWHKDCEWLMLKKEKETWKHLNSDKERERFIDNFFEARDPDWFTFQNEFRAYYEKNLEVVREKYPDLDDPRRYVYLLFGEPYSKRTFMNDHVNIQLPDFSIRRIETGEGEIWEYKTANGVFEIIFGKLDLNYLQNLWGRYLQEGQVSFASPITRANFEIFYLGPKRYISVADFLVKYFQEGCYVVPTDNVIVNQKKAILERAEEFLKAKEPEVNKKLRKGKYSNGQLGVRILIDQFGFVGDEPRLNIWCLFSKDALEQKKNNEYRAEISLFCEVRNQNNERVIAFKQDSIEYKLRKKQSYYYSFWGSLPPGQYKLILEMGENKTKKYKRMEVELRIWSFSLPGLQADLIVGKLYQGKQDWIKEKLSSMLSVKKGKFLPLFLADYFSGKDQLAVFFNVAGFQRDNYGNPYLCLAILFARDGNEPSYAFNPLQNFKEDIFEGFTVLTIDELIEKLNLVYGYYTIKLSVNDVVAGEAGIITYPSKTKPHKLLIIATSSEKK